MPDDLRHFLVVRRLGKLDSIVAFDDINEALRAYGDKVRECTRINDPLFDTAVECVLLDADRLSTCIGTHGSWFDEPGEPRKADKRDRLQAVVHGPTHAASIDDLLLVELARRVLDLERKLRDA